MSSASRVALLRAGLAATCWVALTGASPFAGPCRADELEQLFASLREAAAKAEPGLVLEFEASALKPRSPGSGEEAGTSPLGLSARRDVAALAAAVGGTAQVPLAIASLGDPDPEVRAGLLGLLGRADLGDELAAERAAALIRTAESDPVAGLRQAALAALGRLPADEGVRGLEVLLFRLPAEEQLAAADALAETARGRAALVGRVQRLFGPEGGDDLARLSKAAVASLLASYGYGLAELPGGGQARRDRLPLVLAQRNPAGAIRVGAALGLDNLISRLGVLGEDERRLAVLEALAGEGFGDDLLDYRTAWLELTRGKDPRRALAPAVRLGARAAGDASLEDRRWRFYGAYLHGAALLAAGEARAALPHFERAGMVLDALLAERVDLRPHPQAKSRAMGALDADYAELRAVVALTTTALWIAEGRSASDPEVLELARRTHVRALEAQSRAAASGYRTGAESFDRLLEHELGPQVLIFGNAANDGWTRERALGILVELGHALASVAPTEMPGFLPAEGLAEDVANPLRDEERRRLLRGIVVENIEQMRKEVDDELKKERPNRILVQNLSYRIQTAFERLGEGGEREEEVFLEQRAPSRAALNLAQILRAEGRPEDGRELTERMLAAIDDASAGGNDWSKVSIELSIGASLTDEGRPREAEGFLLRALERLEALENTLIERLALVADDAQLTALVQGDLEVTRGRKADALVSLAVNANVGLHDSERALAYFERAFELRQGDFNRVLLACYRARSGRFEEARAQLREVVVSPQLFYNLACTHALMGELETALDYLQREFAENLLSGGERKRQADWARKDPDLASLHGDPRFDRILAP